MASSPRRWSRRWSSAPTPAPSGGGGTKDPPPKGAAPGRLPADAIAAPLYAAGLLRLGDQLASLLAAGTRAVHVDVGDGHFVDPIALGPIVAAAVAPPVHDAGALVDCHLMVDEPERHIDQFAAAGADHVTFHLEASRDPGRTIGRIHDAGMGAGIAIRPETTVDAAVEAATATTSAGATTTADVVLCMSVHPGMSGQSFLPGATARVAELRRRLPDDGQIQVDGGVGTSDLAQLAAAGAALFVAGSSVFWHGDPAVGFAELLAALDRPPAARDHPEDPA